MDAKNILKKFGLNDKEVEIYLKLLELGPSSVRELASSCAINRGTTYDILKSLISLNLVSYFLKNKKQNFIATDPEKLKSTAYGKKKEIEETIANLDKIIPELKSIYNDATLKPKAKFYEGISGIKIILQDVLNALENTEKKEYYVYSSADLKKYLYKSFPEFTRERIKKDISVKVLSLGQGGKLFGLDQRKWIDKSKHGGPTYTIIYANKTAFISLDAQNRLFSIIIEDKNIYKTQKIIFENLWTKI